MRTREDEAVPLGRKLPYTPVLGAGGTVWGREVADSGGQGENGG